MQPTVEAPGSAEKVKVMVFAVTTASCQFTAFVTDIGEHTTTALVLRPVAVSASVAAPPAKAKFKNATSSTITVVFGVGLTIRAPVPYRNSKDAAPFSEPTVMTFAAAPVPTAIVFTPVSPVPILIPFAHVPSPMLIAVLTPSPPQMEISVTTEAAVSPREIKPV